MKKTESNDVAKFDIVAACSETILNKLNTRLDKEGLEYEKLKLGIEVIVFGLSKLILVLILAICLDILKPVLVMVLVNTSLKKNSCGLHANSPNVCMIMTLAMFLLPPIFFTDVYLNTYIVFAVFLVYIFLLYKYAPADTANHPLLGAELRKTLKTRTLVAGIIWMIITLLLPSSNLQFFILLSILYTVIAVCPITYKILKRSHDNYETYE